MTFYDSLYRHISDKQPYIEFQDIVKFCYQAARGAEHLLADTDAAHRYFVAEYESLGRPNETKDESLGQPLAEPLSDTMCRVNMAAWKQAGLPCEALFDIFVQSARQFDESPERLQEYLKTAGLVLAELDNFDVSQKSQSANQMQICHSLNSYYVVSQKSQSANQMQICHSLNSEYAESQQSWDDYVTEYIKSGMPAVHHSEIYRQYHKPAYRIASIKAVCEYAGDVAVL